MSWQLWIVAGVMACSAILSIAYVGKERTPISPALAATTVVINATLIGLIFWGAA